MKAARNAIPGVPLALTLAGLVPFAGLAAHAWWAGDAAVARAQSSFVLLVYAAVILSFLGGVRWGAACAAAAPAAPPAAVMAGSVLGALAGWAFVLAGILGNQMTAALFCAGAALMLHGAWDILAPGAMPGWYPRLRSVATLGAAGAMVAAGLAYVVL